MKFFSLSYNRFENLSYFFLTTVVFLLTACGLFFYTDFLPQDASMYLDAGKLIFEGKVPFKDFYDINPPAIMYFSAVIFFLSKKIGISSIITFKLFTLINSSVLLSFAYILLNKLMSLDKKGTLYFFIFALTGALFDISNYYWGQREDFFAVALLPYLLLKLVRIKFQLQNSEIPRSVKIIAVIVGLTIAISATFKPHFYLFIVAAELFYAVKIIKKRSFFSLELIGIILVGLVYLIFLVNLPEPTFTNFWVVHMKQVLTYYNSFNITYFHNNFYMLISFLLISIFMARNWAHKTTLMQLFYIQGCIAIITILLQLRFFTYHFIPLNKICLFLTLIYFIQKPKIKSKYNNQIFLLVLCIFTYVLCYSTYKYFINPRGNEIHFTKVLTHLLKQYSKKSDCVLGLSAMPMISYPSLVNLELTNCSRYLFQYKLSFFSSRREKDLSVKQNYTNNSTFKFDEEKYFEEIKFEIENRKPDLIYYFVYPGSHQNMQPEFPLEKYLEKNGVLAFINARYRKIVDGYFTFYIRI